MTGGKSTLGKVRLGKATNLGTTELLDESKNLIEEFKGNIGIRENIAKNLTPDTIEQFRTLFPVQRGETALIKSAQNLTSPELLEQDKQLKTFLEKVLKKLIQVCGVNLQVLLQLKLEKELLKLVQEH